MTCLEGNDFLPKTFQGFNLLKQKKESTAYCKMIYKKMERLWRDSEKCTIGIWFKTQMSLTTLCVDRSVKFD